MAKVQYIPIEVDGTDFFFNILSDLEGKTFRLNFSWNGIDTHWYLSIFDDTETLIPGCSSIRLVNEIYPLRRVTSTLRPEGELFLFSEAAGDPNLTNLGEQFLLYYIPKELVDEWRATV